MPPACVTASDRRSAGHSRAWRTRGTNGTRPLRRGWQSAAVSTRAAAGSVIALAGSSTTSQAVMAMKDARNGSPARCPDGSGEGGSGGRFGSPLTITPVTVPGSCVGSTRA